MHHRTGENLDYGRCRDSLSEFYSPQKTKTLMLPRSHLQTRTQIEQTLRVFPVNTKKQKILSSELTTKKYK